MMEEDLIIETWDIFKEYIPEKSRETAANQYVDFLLGKDVELSTLEGLTGYDPHLDIAINIVLEENSDVDEDVDDDDNWDYNEAED
jgi:hypothetical protein